MVLRGIAGSETSTHVSELLVDWVSDAILVIDGQGLIRFFNPSAERLLGRSRDDLIGSPFGFPVANDEITEIDILRPNGEIRIVEMRSVELPWEGHVAHVASLRDITERKEIEGELQEVRDRLELATLGANDGLWDWDIDSNSLYVTQRFKAMIGLSPEEFGTTPEHWWSLVHADDIETLQADIYGHRAGFCPQLSNEHRLLHADGTYRWFLVRGVARRGQHGDATRMAGSLTDITHRKRFEERILHHAFHDPLTGLPNRASFMDRLSLTMTRRNQEDLFAVLFLDVDEFKQINDRIGHKAGDQLLVEIGRRLKRCLRLSDSVARLAGDEFVCLLDEVGSPSDALRVARRISEEIAQPCFLDEHEVMPSVSIGISLSTTPYDQPDEMLEDADAAMYRSKAGGRGRIVIFDTTIQEQARRHLVMEEELKRALENNEFELYFQPIVWLGGRQPWGVESLLRWRHPNRGLLGPEDFLDAAKSSGLMKSVGHWVYREVCRASKQFRWSVPDAPVTTLNIGREEVLDSDFLACLSEAVEEFGVDFQQLAVEFRAEDVVRHEEDCRNLAARLRQHGVRSLLDNCGTDPLPVRSVSEGIFSAIKLDKNLVRRKDCAAQRTMRGLAALCRELGIPVVATGIEGEEDLDRLLDLQIHIGQGFELIAPMERSSTSDYAKSCMDREGGLAKTRGRSPRDDSRLKL